VFFFSGRRRHTRWPRDWSSDVCSSDLVFRSVNSYGLFAVMTTSRPEIIIKGSVDGTEWKTYEFKYKPGDLQRRPRFCWPHQPREIGRASCRERVEDRAGAVLLKEMNAS